MSALEIVGDSTRVSNIPFTKTGSDPKQQQQQRIGTAGTMSSGRCSTRGANTADLHNQTPLALPGLPTSPGNDSASMSPQPHGSVGHNGGQGRVVSPIRVNTPVSGKLTPVVKTLASKRDIEMLKAAGAKYKNTMAKGRAGQEDMSLSAAQNKAFLREWHAREVGPAPPPSMQEIPTSTHKRKAACKLFSVLTFLLVSLGNLQRRKWEDSKHRSRSVEPASPPKKQVGPDQPPAQITLENLSLPLSRGHANRRGRCLTDL
jgi:hypothetical protein